jgi:hypothetical protein
LSAEDCAYRDTPFVEPVPGPEFAGFWRALAKLRSDNHIEFEVLALKSDRAIVDWHAFSRRTTTGERREGDGIFVLTFATDGRCRDVASGSTGASPGRPSRSGHLRGIRIDGVTLPTLVLASPARLSGISNFKTD